MENKEKEIHQLAVLYWEGKLPVQAESILFEFISNEENRTTYANWEKEWQASRQPEPETDKEWLRFQNRIHLNRTIPEAGFVFSRQLWRTMVAAATVALIILMGGIGGNQIAKLLDKETFVVEAPLGQKSKITLPDGTIVRLNAGTQIRYSNRFNISNRTIQLDGEAYFEVSRQDNNPFIVKIKEYDVVVKGTKFNISSYPNDDYVKTALMEGSLLLAFQGKEYRMKPGEMMQLRTQTGSLRLFEINAEQHKSWTEDRIEYDEITLRELFSRLSRQYNVPIAVDSNINTDAVLSISLNNRETLNEIIYGIAKIIPFQYHYENNQLYVSN